MGGHNFPILVQSGGTSRTTAKLMKTGQTTSYRTGDDGDLERGRDVDFFTLAENNPFGNTNRFTDELGGQAYTNNWVVDWSTYDGSTVLGYFRSVQLAATWDNAIDNCLAGTFGTFAGCYLPNVTQINNIMNFEINETLDYTPFSINLVTLWTSDTNRGGINYAWYYRSSGVRTVFTKTLTNGWLPVRNFTVTGTTLT